MWYVPTKVVSNPYTPLCVGYTQDIFKILSSRMGFKMSWTIPPDGNYGQNLENGTTTGMINQLVSKNADVTTTALIVTLSRNEVVDYSVNLFSSETVISAWSFTQTSFTIWAYVNVFSLGAWCGTLTLLSICILCLFQVNKQYRFFETLFFVFRDRQSQFSPKNYKGIVSQ